MDGVPLGGVIGVLLQPVFRQWGKVRMKLPFVPKTRKAYWNLLLNEKRINWAIEETSAQDFEQELRDLYPILEKYGMKMPIIDPVRIGEERWDSPWREFHLELLKVLRRSIRNKKFDLLEWNYNVGRKNSERNSDIERYRSTIIALDDPNVQQFKALYPVIKRQADSRHPPFGLVNRALRQSSDFDIDYVKMTTTLNQLGIPYPQPDTSEQDWYYFLVPLATLAQDGKVEEARTLWPTQKEEIDRKAQAKAVELENNEVTKYE